MTRIGKKCVAVALLLLIAGLASVAVWKAFARISTPDATRQHGRVTAAVLVYEPKLAPALHVAKHDGERLLAKRGLHAYVRIFVKARVLNSLSSNPYAGLFSQSGDVFTAIVACEDLARLAQLPDVVYIEEASQEMLVGAAEKLRFHNVLNSQAVGGTEPPRRRPPIVGLVERSLDPYDPAVSGAEAAGSRYLAIWDQTDQRGTSPSEISNAYGTEYLRQAIRGAGQPIPMTAGAEAHGARVARVIAKHADPAIAWHFVAVKTNGDRAAVVDGVNYIRRKARQLNRPLVINLSLGSSASPHDGCSLLEQAIASAVGPGELIVVAAGNRAETRGHAKLWGRDWNVDGQAVLAVSVDSHPPSATPRVKGTVRVELWFRGNPSFSVTVDGPEGIVLGPIRPTQGRIRSGRFGQVGVCYGLSRPPNGDQELLVVLADAEEGMLATGLWRIKIGSDGQSLNCECDAWVEATGGYHGQFESHVTSTGTVTAPATSLGVLCVGAGDPQTRGPFPPSGLGPTRDGRTKPDIWCPTQPSSSLASAEVTGRLIEYLARDPRLRPTEAASLLRSR